MRPVTRQLISIFTAATLSAATPMVVSAQDTAESGPPVAAVIDGYVREGLKSNLALRAQSLEVERADAALDAARARYFPEAAFSARYTRAEGGRTIELPLGDALNPA
jgi:outer membrane protein TolC